ncbi:PHP domain-containing protein [Thermosipho ferrireducens]|uniref:PHP domain-containing protein n=1 Tax=Thermosipho ferrireducens TaxID=2571116 RepID=A0ABX7S973_9BACT|nr:PHP domain-containing protein [Thermosipho ferrireducens]QTA37908.1 PHP domain-containing protein [Thermosipho ferrireducens]
MVIDLHNHCELSKNTDLKLTDYVKRAKVLNISLAITEHNRLYNVQGKVNGVHVFSGIEILNDYGDFIVFGAPESCVELRNNIFEFIDYVHKSGGVVIAAHPFSGYGVCRINKNGLANEIIKLVDAIEVYNGKAERRFWQQAEKLARIYKKPGTGGSDAHNVSDLFKVGTQFFEKIENIYDLVKAIKDGKCKPVLIDKHK